MLYGFGPPLPRWGERIRVQTGDMGDTFVEVLRAWSFSARGGDLGVVGVYTAGSICYI